MEEKKVKLDKLVENYISNKITYKEFEKEVKALYADKEESKPTLREFDLEAAKEGKPVCTRDGKKVKIICFDVKGSIHPIVALIEDGERERLCSYMPNGRRYEDEEWKDDLMMLPEKKEGWIVIHKEAIYDKETAGKIARETTADVIRIQKIEWKE